MSSVFTLHETVNVPDGMFVRSITVAVNGKDYVCKDPSTMFCKDSCVYVICPSRVLIVQEKDIKVVDILFETIST